MCIRDSLRAVLGAHAHVLVTVNVGEAVVDQVIQHLDVPQPGAVPHVERQVRGVAHRLEAAGDDDLRLTEGDGLGCGDDGLQTRAAHLVQGVGGNGVGNPGPDRRLTAGSLSLAGLEDVPHPDLLDLPRVDAGSLEGLLDGDGAELRRGERGQGPLEAPDGSTGSTDNDDVTGHGHSLRLEAKDWIVTGGRPGQPDLGHAGFAPQGRLPKCRPSKSRTPVRPPSSTTRRSRSASCLNSACSATRAPGRPLVLSRPDQSWAPSVTRTIQPCRGAGPRPRRTISSFPSFQKTWRTTSKPSCGELHVPTTHRPESPARSSQSVRASGMAGPTQSSLTRETVELQTRRTFPAPRSPGCWRALPRPGSTGSPMLPAGEGGWRSEQSRGC